MRIVMLAAMGLLLSACATPTPYAPADPGTGYGFHEQQLEANRVRITFSGNSLTDRSTVENYLLYRAAELTLQHNKDYFVMVARSTQPHHSLEAVGPRFPYEYRFFSPRRGWLPAWDPFWDEPQSYREISRYEASAEIVMYSGRKPADDPAAFDAHEVQHNLEGQIVRPAPPTH